MSTDTRILGGVVASLAVLLLPGSSRVNAQEPGVRVQLPFEFTAGATTLPRDTYEVSRLGTMRDVVELRSPRHHVFVLALTETSESNPKLMPSLVFDRHGSQYFLRGVRLAEGVDVRLPETRQERDAIERRASAASAEVVVVAAEPQ